MTAHASDLAGRVPVSRHRPQHQGFTLIELLIVIIVIGILAAIAVPMYLGQRNKAKDAATKENVHTLEVGVQSYALASNDTYPSTGDLDEAVGGYVDAWPENPFTGSPMGSSPSVGDYSYTNNDDGSFSLAGHLSTDSDFAVGVSNGSVTSIFTTTSDYLIGLLLDYYEEYGKWPRTWGDYVYTDLGLDPEEYGAPIDHVIFTPHGSQLYAEPEDGYEMTVTGTDGVTRVLDSDLHWNLVYDAVGGQWYYHRVEPANQIDISTLTTAPQG